MHLSIASSNGSLGNGDRNFKAKQPEIFQSSWRHFIVWPKKRGRNELGNMPEIVLLVLEIHKYIIFRNHFHCPSFPELQQVMVVGSVCFQTKEFHMYSHTSRQWRKFAFLGNSFRIIDSNLLILNFFSNEAEMLTDNYS